MPSGLAGTSALLRKVTPSALLERLATIRRNSRNHSWIRKLTNCRPLGPPGIRAHATKTSNASTNSRTRGFEASGNPFRISSIKSV